MYNVTMKQYENTQVTNPILLFKMKSHQIQVREKEMERSHLKKKFLKKYEREQIKKKKRGEKTTVSPVGVVTARPSGHVGITLSPICTHEALGKVHVCLHIFKIHPEAHE